jgi:hypothetical protein
MLTRAHKLIARDLVAERLADLRHTLALARASFSEQHPTVCALRRRAEDLQSTLEALDAEPARVAA